MNEDRMACYVGNQYYITQTVLSLPCFVLFYQLGHNISEMVFRFYFDS